MEINDLNVPLSSFPESEGNGADENNIQDFVDFVDQLPRMLPTYSI